MPRSLQPSKNDSMDSIIFPVSENIKSLSERIHQLNNSVINPNDMLIFNAFFDRYDNGSYGPFYVWKNDEVRDKIERLFDGEKVYLYADVSHSDQRNVVKFNLIDLEFRSDNQTINNELTDALQSFHVSLTHMGQSNYRCDNDVYTIASRPLKIEFSFAGKKDAPTDQNSAYEKLKNGIKLLSPYTLWAVQLSRGNFEQLKPFAGAVNIELHGYGQYVVENEAICKTNLEKYYSLRKN